MSFAVLYARGIWCFYQRDEQKFGVFENRVLRKICESGGGKWKLSKENCLTL